MKQTVTGARYQNQSDAQEAILLGLRIREVVLRDVRTDAVFTVTHQKFDEFWMDMNQHDHASFCCDIHGLHVSPHQGCLLR